MAAFDVPRTHKTHRAPPTQTQAHTQQSNNAPYTAISDVSRCCSRYSSRAAGCCGDNAGRIGGDSAGTDGDGVAIASDNDSVGATRIERGVPLRAERTLTKSGALTAANISAKTTVRGGTIVTTTKMPSASACTSLRTSSGNSPTIAAMSASSTWSLTCSCRTSGCSCRLLLPSSSLSFKSSIETMKTMDGT
eukprot:3363539-Prymnesium_polylepis.2